MLGLLRRTRGATGTGQLVRIAAVTATSTPSTVATPRYRHTAADAVANAASSKRHYWGTAKVAPARAETAADDFTIGKFFFALGASCAAVTPFYYLQENPPFANKNNSADTTANTDRKAVDAEPTKETPPYLRHAGPA